MLLALAVSLIILFSVATLLLRRFREYHQAAISASTTAIITIVTPAPIHPVPTGLTSELLLLNLQGYLLYVLNQVEMPHAMSDRK